MSQAGYELDADRMAMCVAYDHTVLGLSQEEIGRQRNLSESTVSRRMGHARKLGYLKEGLTLTAEEIHSISEHLCDYHTAHALWDFFAEFGTHFLREGGVVVVPSGQGAESSPPAAAAVGTVGLSRVAAAAAQRLYRACSQGTASTVGISWGRTMGAMVRKLVTWPQPEDKDGERGRSIEFVPILGDLLLERAAPLYSENHRCHATNLAAQLADFFGQTRSRILLHAPAYIPEGFQPKTEHAERVRTARAFIEAIPAYRLVFGERRDGLIDRVDTLVTSVGGPLVLDPEDQGWLRPTVTNADERASLQSAGVVGDLCGRFVTKTQVTNFPADSAITAANDRCFGPQIEHFRECATRARDTAASRNSEDPSPGLGVMVVAAGAEKAEVVFSVCFNKLVNELVVDSDLAAALLKLTKEYNAGTGTGGPRRR